MIVSSAVKAHRSVCIGRIMVMQRRKYRYKSFLFNGKPEFRLLCACACCDFIFVAGGEIRFLRNIEQIQTLFVFIFNNNTDYIFWAWEKCSKGLSYKISLNKFCIQSYNNT